MRKYNNNVGQNGTKEEKKTLYYIFAPGKNAVIENEFLYITVSWTYITYIHTY
jgi:hypothetical protein